LGKEGQPSRNFQLRSSSQEILRWRRAISAFADIHVTSASPPLNSQKSSIAGPRCLVQMPGYDVWMKWVDDLSLEVISTLTTAYDARTSLSTRTLLHLFDGAVRASHPMRTAFGMRLEHFTVLIYSIWEAADAARAAIHCGWASIADFVNHQSSIFPPLGLPS
jgi:hypothetical protein